MRVIAAWAATHPDPVAVAAGAALWLDGRSEDWDGHRWLWARDALGRAGWVPDDLPEPHGAGHRARARYDATELGCAPGEWLTALDETHGWVLCRDGAGRTGWVPVRNLVPDGGADDAADTAAMT